MNNENNAVLQPGGVVLEPPALHVRLRDHGPRRQAGEPRHGAAARAGERASGPLRAVGGALAAAGDPGERRAGSRPRQRGVVGPLAHLRQRCSAAGLPARMEPQPRQGRAPAHALRQGDVLPRPRRDRRHQIPVGAQPPPGAGVPGPGLAAHRRFPLPRRHRHGPRQLVRPVPVSPRRQLVERAGGGHPPDQLGDRVAADRRPAVAAVRQPAGQGAAYRLAQFGVAPRRVHPRPPLGALVGQQPPDRRTGRAVRGGRHLALLGGGQAVAAQRPGRPRARDRHPEQRGRRQPGAVQRLPAVRVGFPADGRTGRPGHRQALLRALPAAPRGDGRIRGGDHG